MEQAIQKPKMTAIWVIVIYCAMQFSGIVLNIPAILNIFLEASGLQGQEARIWAVGMWNTAAFAIATALTLFITNRDKDFWNIFKGQQQASLGETIGWGFAGFILVMFAQYIAIYIETLIGIPQGSDNTATIMEISKIAPAMFLATVLFGPILEEILFRRIIFGSFVGRFGFIIAALISSFVFAVIHFDFAHILIYVACGFTFAFVYYKTKRILASIITHILMNGFVALSIFIVPQQATILFPWL